MRYSAEQRVAMKSLSNLKNNGGVFTLLTFFILAFSCLTLVSAAPTDSEAVNLPDVEERNANPLEPSGLPQSYDSLLPREVEEAVVPTSVDSELEKRQSAGLFWGPKKVGNLKLYLTNPHVGYAGPKFPNANHVNFHVDKEAGRTYKSVVNLHIVKYKTGSKFCLYIWDSVTGATVFDNCFNDFAKAIPAGVSAVKSFVDSLLRNADFFASIIIIGALVVALAAVIASLGVVAVA